MNQNKLIIGIIALVLAIGFIFVALNMECEMGDITSGGEVVMELPSQLEKMMCLSGDWRSLILLITGISLLFYAPVAIVKSLTEK